MTGPRKTPALSVVLPTYNRADALGKVLKSLATQDCPPESFEVVVVDDGSSDSTPRALADFAATTSLSLRFHSLERNSGPAAARNAALRMARGEVIVIIGDDIIVPPDFVERHAAWHLAHPDDRDAMLGYVTWPEEISPSRFMRWLEGGGRAFFFSYADMKKQRPVGGSCFYTCNVSLKRALLFRTSLFDESFPHASHEDLELGYRLEKLGMRLFFEPSAVGYHWHYLTLPSALRRVYLMGYSASIYWDKVEDSAGTVKRILRSLLPPLFSSPPGEALWQRLGSRASGEKSGAIVFKTLLTLSYWIGLDDCRRGRAPRDTSVIFRGTGGPGERETASDG